MQLSDILEENSVKMMAQKTKISEENLENLLAKKFEYLKKVKTMGFISILEREYKADLSAVRQEATAYYNANNEDRSVTLGTTVVEEKKGKSGFFLLFILLLLGYATWYFFTQFDKKHLSALLPFIDEATIENFVGDSKNENTIAEDLSIANVNLAKKEIANAETEEVAQKIEVVSIPTATPKPTVEVEEAETSEDTQNENAEISTEENTNTNETTLDEADNTIAEDETSTIEEPAQEVEESETVVETVAAVETIKNESIRIVPARRLWFGMTDMTTKKRKNLTISKPYSLDVRTKSWLIATSIAPFSIVANDDKKSYKNGKSHYFKIDADGIHPLTKRAYVKQGGYRRW